MRLHINIICLTSSVISDVTDWTCRGIIIPHEPIRRALDNLHDIVETDNFNLQKYPWKANILKIWYVEFFYPYIHNHHDIEEKIYLPWLVSKQDQIPERISHDHITLTTIE